MVCLRFFLVVCELDEFRQGLREVDHMLKPTVSTFLRGSARPLQEIVDAPELSLRKDKGARISPASESFAQPLFEFEV